MPLIIETDLGHDPDDFFAICYLAAASVDIRAITLVPGNLYQVRLAKFLTKELGLDIPIGIAESDLAAFVALTSDFASNKHSSEVGADGGIHLDILKQYGNKSKSADGSGHKIISDILEQDPDCDLFIIGPATSSAKALTGRRKPKKLVMQGGFLSYAQNPERVPQLDKFKDQPYQPSFNLNGNRRAALRIISSYIPEKYFVGKNVCHMVEYTPQIHQSLQINNRAAELFKEFGDLYFTKHQTKKFHDPTAAVCYLHPEIATWVKGYPTQIGSGWGSNLVPYGDNIISSIEYDKLWEHITNFT